jgi:hypothetical protein
MACWCRFALPIWLDIINDGCSGRSSPVSMTVTAAFTLLIYGFDEEAEKRSK